MNEETRSQLRLVKQRKIKDPERALAILRDGAGQIEKAKRQAMDDERLYRSARDSLIAGKKLDGGYLIF